MTTTHVPPVLTLPLDSWDRCESNPCPHCAAGHPEPPEGTTLDSIFELDEADRLALPPAFHQPHFSALGRPATWICTACWGDGWTSGFPCAVAQAHGVQVAQATGLGYSR